MDARHIRLPLALACTLGALPNACASWQRAGGKLHRGPATPAHRARARAATLEEVQVLEARLQEVVGDLRAGGLGGRGVAGRASAAQVAPAAGQAARRRCARMQRRAQRHVQRACTSLKS